MDESNESTLFAMDGYDFFRSDRNRQGIIGTKKGGGLATYVRADCFSDPSKYAHLNKCNEHIEVQIITAKKKNDRASVIINVYRPPSGNVEYFIEEITQIIEPIYSERYKDIFLLGDFNIDHGATRRTKATKSLESALLGYGLYQYINCPTRVTLSSKSLIDVIYIRTSKEVYPFTITTTISDHYLVGTTRYLNYTSPQKTEFLGERIETTHLSLQGITMLE